MKEIVLKGICGDREINYIIKRPFISQDLIQIFVDDDYRGLLAKRNGEWEASISPDNGLYSNDIGMILEGLGI